MKTVYAVQTFKRVALHKLGVTTFRYWYAFHAEAWLRMKQEATDSSNGATHLYRVVNGNFELLTFE